MVEAHRPAAVHRAYLSLGSNIDAESNLRSALRGLRERFGDIVVSPLYRTRAVGFDGDDFLNLAAVIESDLDVHALNDWLHAFEDAHGRRRDQPRFSARTLDVDIVFFDDLIVQGPGNLQIPRPELMHAFVLKPLVDIAPQRVVPGTSDSLAALWARHAERDVPIWKAGTPL
jgi:2-amino-4-hydroxy-6-hydroxymethyldihydropteridine diphosphokinase